MKKIISVVAVCFFLFSCSKSGGTNNGGSGNGGSGSGTTCSGPAKSFATDVNPVIQASCAGCHGAGSIAGPGPLLTYAQVFNARAAIRSAVSSGRMPPNGGLSVTQKNAILCWIDNGAPNN